MIFIAMLLVGVCFYLKIDKKIDLSLIEPTGSSITKIYYFDFEDREKRIGKPIEIKEEQIFLQKSEWKSLYSMPKNLINAFVSIEDKRFYDHNGVDWPRTAKAVMNYVFGTDKSSFGGSTITQQLIKNLTGENKSTVRRKAEEIFRAINLEKETSKNKILESYLNIVFLSENCYGVESASNVYFNKDVEDLTLVECASLASIVKNPSKYDPYKNPDENKKRRKVVLHEMFTQGYISKDEYEKAKNEELKINENIQSTINPGVYSWYTETLINEVTNDLMEKYDVNENTARMLIYKGGLNIYSVIDPEIQKIAESVYNDYTKYLPKQNGKYPESSCVIIDPKTSDILALIGGKGKKESNLILNRATMTKRAPGSIIKPLSVYSPSIEEGIVSYSTIIDDTPLLINDKIWPKNSPNRYRGLMSVSYALTHSVNTVSVKTLQKLGIDKSYDYLTNRFQLELDEKDKELAPLALGQLTYGESLLNLTNAYSCFVNGGFLSNPKTYLYVTNSEGDIILEKENSKNKILSTETTQIITKMLENVIKEGTGRTIEVKENITIAGKTGTSSGNKDKWFIGYSPELVCGVWTGFDIPESINVLKNPSCQVFNKIFEEIYEDDEALHEFEVSDEIIKVEYCKDSGLLPCDNCKLDLRGDRVTVGFFKKGTEPTEFCKIHKLVTIDVLDGLIANDTTPNWRKRTVSLLDYRRRNEYNDVIILDEEYFIPAN